MEAEIIVKGNIFTGNPRMPYVSCMAIRDGAFIYVGDEAGAAEYAGPDTEIKEVSGGLITAAIQDGHAHISMSMAALFEVDLNPYKTIKDYQRAIRGYIAEHPEKDCIYGRGFLNGVFPNGTATKNYLDEISTDLLLYMESEDGHTAWVNSKVLEVCGIDSGIPDVKDGVIGRDGKGNPNGCFREAAEQLLKKAEAVYTKEDIKKAILYYQDMAFDYGISNVFEPLGGNISVKMEAYRELVRENKLKVHTTVGLYINPEDDWQECLKQFSAYRDEIKSDMFKIDSIKVFIDGVVEGHTAFLKEEYADVPGDCGESMWKDEKLYGMFAAVEKEGYSLHVHAIGDGAISQALDAFAYADKEAGIENNRNTITHVQVLDEGDYKRFADLHVIAAVNPYWHYRQPFYYEELEVIYLGRKRAEKEYPIKSFCDAGAVVTFASDWPVSVPCNPWIGMEISVTRKEPGNKSMLSLNPEERVTPEEALYCLTRNGAYQNHLEERYGSIEAGKQADFLVLNQNPLTIDPYRIHETRVLEHYVKGKCPMNR